MRPSLTRQLRFACKCSCRSHLTTELGTNNVLPSCPVWSCLCTWTAIVLRGNCHACAGPADRDAWNRPHCGLHLPDLALAQLLQPCAHRQQHHHAQRGLYQLHQRRAEQGQPVYHHWSLLHCAVSLSLSLRA